MKEFGEHLSIPDYIQLGESLGFPSSGMLYDVDGARFFRRDVMYERWGPFCNHGKYSICLCIGLEAAEFMDCLKAHATAVVDDFGNLVRVN